MKKNKKVLVILSGGLDSTTLLYDMVHQGYEVEAVSFFYKQRHSKELDFARRTTEKLNIPHRLIDISFMSDMLSKTSLIAKNNIDIPEGDYREESMKSTVVPARNLIMSSIAISLASEIQAHKVAIGVHSGDHDIYPDCRPEFIEKLNEVAKIADYWKVEIIAPYVDMSKGDIVRRGLEIGADYSDAWTCYKGKEKACGACGSCIERLEAFEDNNAVDPIEYENR